MNTQLPNKQQNKPPPRKYFFLSIALLLVIGGTFLWVLNGIGIIGGSLSSTLGPIFTGIGISVALLQWHAQVTSGLPTHTASPSPHSSVVKWHPLLPLESINFGTTRQKGALIIHAHRKFCGTNLYLCKGFTFDASSIAFASSIVRRRMKGHSVYVGIFLALEPGNYTLSTNTQEHLAMITIHAGNIAEIDWREKPFLNKSFSINA